MMHIQILQEAFDSLSTWEKEMFLNNNACTLIEDITSPREKHNLGDIETEDLAAWLIDNGMATCDELLDAVVKDVEELRDIMIESAIYDYECEDDIIDEDEYYSTPATSNNFDPDEDFPY